jgi:hypothetical protein
MTQANRPDKSTRLNGRQTFSERMGAVAAAVATSTIAGLGLWGCIYFNSRKPEMKSLWDLGGALLQEAADRVTAFFCSAVAALAGVSAPVFIFWSLMPHRPDDKPEAAEQADE